MNLEIFANNMKVWENFISYTAVIITVGIAIGIAIGGYLKNKRIGRLKQMLADETLQNNVEVHGLKTDLQFSEARVAKLEAALKERDREVITLRQQNISSGMTIIARNVKIAALEKELAKAPKVLIVPNINPHHAADTEYIGVYPSEDSGLEPAHLTREVYNYGVQRLKDHPEDFLKPIKDSDKAT